MPSILTHLSHVLLVAAETEADAPMAGDPAVATDAVEMAAVIVAGAPATAVADRTSVVDVMKAAPVTAVAAAAATAKVHAREPKARYLLRPRKISTAESLI